MPSSPSPPPNQRIRGAPRFFGWVPKNEHGITLKAFNAYSKFPKIHYYIAINWE